MFGWGYSGAGPQVLYQALVHAMDGSVAPATWKLLSAASVLLRREAEKDEAPDA